MSYELIALIFYIFILIAGVVVVAIELYNNR